MVGGLLSFVFLDVKTFKGTFLSTRTVAMELKTKSSGVTGCDMKCVILAMCIIGVERGIFLG